MDDREYLFTVEYIYLVEVELICVSNENGIVVD